MNTTAIDPRPLYPAGTRWITELMSNVTPDRMTAPTPCSEFAVAELLGHLVATVRRARVIGEGGDPHSVPVVVEGLTDYASAYAASAAEAVAIWSDPARLDRMVTVPWGTVPGRAAMFGYLNETLVHGWDLAVATGQDPEADPSIAEPMVDIVRTAIPETPRGGHVPFADVVDSRDGAGPTERIANWSGRTSIGWIRTSD